jgi:Immunoglobulin I-set domain
LFRYKGETEFFTDEHIKVDSEAMRSNEITLSLRLRSVTMSDAGEYRAVATNIAGKAVSSSLLTVNSKSAS